MGNTKTFMKYIAHRGQTAGPKSDQENHPALIELALNKGYDVEIDLRMQNGKLYLGHDGPQHPIDEKFLQNSKFWIHVKDKETLEWISKNKSYPYNYFWHENDKYTVTSKGYIWAHPSSELTESSVMVMPESIDPKMKNAIYAKCFAICSDYVDHIKKIRDML
jgi:hypothetical protein